MTMRIRHSASKVSCNTVLASRSRKRRATRGGNETWRGIRYAIRSRWRREYLMLSPICGCAITVGWELNPAIAMAMPYRRR